MTTMLLSPELSRAARLYKLVDHLDPQAVRREAARRRKVAQAAGLWVATDASVEVSDMVAHGVPVRVYRPRSASHNRGAVLYLHGGAFISGGLDFEHPRCLEMCRETESVVVSAGYRLAPEFPYPAGLDDCLSVYHWLREQAASLSVDRDRLAIAGASAGGALATAICLKARDHGYALPKMQMLLYPVIDDRLETASMRAFTQTPVWDYANCVHMWNHYLGPVEHRADVAPYAAPSRAADLRGLPPAYVMTAEYDPLRDEGAQYARRLMSAGVSVELHQFSGTFHGFDTLTSAPVSGRARREQYDVLRGGLS